MYIFNVMPEKGINCKFIYEINFSNIKIYIGENICKTLKALSLVNLKSCLYSLFKILNCKFQEIFNYKFNLSMNK